MKLSKGQREVQNNRRLDECRHDADKFINYARVKITLRTSLNNSMCAKIIRFGICFLHCL